MASARLNSHVFVVVCVVVTVTVVVKYSSLLAPLMKTGGSGRHAPYTTAGRFLSAHVIPNNQDELDLRRDLDLDGTAFVRLARALVEAPPNVAHGSHQVNLLAAAYVTEGAMLELGCGYFSTPMLHNISAARGRSLLSADHTYRWLRRLVALRSELHVMERVHRYRNYSRFGELIASSGRWGLAFVDHGVAQRRQMDVRALRDRADLVVVHDAEAPECYHYDFTGYRYSFYERHPAGEVATMVLSNAREDLVNQTRALVLLARDSGI